MTATEPRAGGEQPTALLAPAYRWATIGMVSLIFLSAFESLAVTTIMPTVSAELDGRAWYSAAFSVTLAASVVGMVAGGLWADGSGPRRPLLTSVAVFAGGLLVAGLAPGMEVFVAARFLQGLGAGAMTVALYVLVARIYAPVDHARIFGAFAAAWVVPGVVGPTVAGAVADAVGWRWVFLGVVALALAATSTLLPAVRGTDDVPEPSESATAGRLMLAVVVAAGVVLLDVAGRRDGALGYAGAAVALVVVLLAVRPLLPAGALLARRGLPAVIALRGVAAAAFFSAEIHVPYLLQAQYGVAPWLSGATLTVASFGWAGASHVQGRPGTHLSDAAAMRGGAALLALGIGGVLAGAALHLPPLPTGLLVGLAWTVAGGGMGLMYPRLNSSVLAASAEGEAGGNSAALSISDAVGGATAIALTGLLFAAVGTAADRAPFLAVLALTTAVAVGAALVARRVPVRA